MHQTPEIAKKPLAIPCAYKLIASWICQLGCIGVLFLPFVSVSCTDVDYSYFQQKGWRTYNGFQLACEPVTSHFSPQPEGVSKTKQSEKDLATKLDSSTNLYVPTLMLAPMMFVLPMVGLVTLSLACTIFHSNRAVLRQTARTIMVLTLIVIALKLTFQLPFDVLSALIGIPWSTKGSPPPFRLEWLPAYWFSFPLDVLLLWSIRGWFKEQTETQHSAKRNLKRLAVASILLAGFWAASLYVANQRENQYATNLKVAYLSSREGSLDESKQVLASSPTEFREWEWYYVQRLNYVSPYSRWRFGEIGRHYRPRLVMSTTGSKMVLVSNPLPAEPKRSTSNALPTQPPKITSSRIMVLDTQSGKEAFSLEVPGDAMVACDTYSSDEKLYVYQGDVIKRYSLVSGQSDWSVNIANPVELDAWDDKAGLELIDQGRTLVSTLDQGKQLDFWDIESKQKLPPGSRPNSSRGGKGQRSNAQTSALSGDESVSALVGFGYRPDVLIRKKGNQDFRFKILPGSIMVLGTELSYDGARLAIARIHPVKFVEPPPIGIDIYDTKTGELPGILKCDYGYYSRYHFTRNGNHLLGLRLDTPDQRELDFNRAQICIDVWDLKEMRGGQVLRGHTDSIASIDVSSNGRSVASVSLDGTLRLFDIQRGTCTWTSENLKKNSPEEWGISGIDNDLCVVFSPDDQWIYSTADRKTMNQWNTQTGERSRTFRADLVTNRDRDSNYSRARHCEGSMIRTSPTGSTLLVAMDGRFSEFDLSKDETSLKTSEIDRTGFLSILECDKLNQTYLLVNPLERIQNQAYSNTDLIQLLDAQTGKIFWEKVIPGPTQTITNIFKPEVLPLSSYLAKLNPNQIKISPDGQWIAGPLKAKKLLILNRESGRIIREIPITEGDRFPICWTTDSKRLIHGGNDGRLHIWNPMSGTELLSIMAHPQGVTSLAVTPDGSKIVSGGKDGLIRVWDASSTY